MTEVTSYSPTYLRYAGTRNNVWDILFFAGISSLPVNAFAIADYLSIPVRPFSKNPEAIEYVKTFYPDFSGEGFTIYGKSGAPFCFFDDINQSLFQQYYAILHELGHVVRGHEAGTGSILSCWNKYDGIPLSQDEIDANVFSSRCLAPACVLWALGIQKPRDISKLTGLSKKDSEERAVRMALLYDREREWIKKRGMNCFLKNDKERRLYEQFLPWIDARKKWFRGA